MIFRILISYFFGYVYIQVEGFYIERFINSCIHKNILLWNINREKSTIMFAKISIDDFKKIKKIAKNTKCKIKIKNKKGIPIIINKYRKRKVFFLSLLIIVALILGLSRYIWNVEIHGIDIQEYDSYSQSLNDCGLSVGSLKSSIDTKEIINKLRLEREDIAWVGISIKGTNAIIEIVKRTEKPELINKDEFCDIIAEKDAVITKITVQNGTKAVEVGDQVTKGTVLAYGQMEGKYTGTRYVNAMADIEADVCYTEEETASLSQEIFTRTGNEEKKYSININNFKINLYKRFSKFENCDTIMSNKKISVFRNLYLPIEIECNTNYETKKENKKYSVEELKNQIVERLSKKIESQIEDTSKIKDKQVLLEQNGNEVTVKLVYTVMENIGVKSKIVF